MNHKDRIYLSPPSITNLEKEMVMSALDSNWITTQGSYIDDFSKAICNYTGAKYCVLTSSGTAALHLSVLSLKIEKGDEVLVSNHTFVASLNAILYVGAIPIIIGNERGGFNMCPLTLESAIRKSLNQNKKLPVAILVTHIYGMPANMSEIKTVAQKYQIKIIEDAAESLGATDHGYQTGTIGDVGIFSFNGNKIITTSGGGALVTNDKDIFEKASYLANQAKDQKPFFYHSELGFNYRLSNILAAIGLAQIKNLDQKIEKRKHINLWYRQFLGSEFGLPILFQNEFSNQKSNFWLTAIIVSSKEIALKIISSLEESNIESRHFWTPMHLQPLYQHLDYFGEKAFDELIFESGICLPSGDHLNKNQVFDICHIINKCFDKS